MRRDPNPAEVAASIQRRLGLLTAETVKDGTVAALSTAITKAIEELEFLASYTRGFLSKDGLVGSEGTAASIDLAARRLREAALSPLEVSPRTSQGMVDGRAHLRRHDDPAAPSSELEP